MVRAKFSNTFAAKKKRILTLPVKIDSMLFGIYKRDSVGIIKEYQNGIRTDSLGLERLKLTTIQAKERKGLSRPMTPLYAWGDDQKKSLINCLRIRKIKNGWKIYPSRGMHHNKDGGKPITLEFLHKIHEYGAIIPNKSKSKKLFGGKKEPIRIPPRPALNRAYRIHLKKLKSRKQETSRLVKKAISLYIEMSETAEMEHLISYNKLFKEFEKD